MDSQAIGNWLWSIKKNVFRVIGYINGRGEINPLDPGASIFQHSTCFQVHWHTRHIQMAGTGEHSWPTNVFVDFWFLIPTYQVSQQRELKVHHIHEEHPQCPHSWTISMIQLSGGGVWVFLNLLANTLSKAVSCFLQNTCLYPTAYFCTCWDSLC